MHFRTRLILIYASFVSILAIAIGAWYSTYSFKQYKNNEYRNLILLAEQLSDQFDETLKSTKNITNYLLSDMDVLGALHTLATVNSDNTVKQRYLEEARSIIRIQICSDYIQNNYHRVIVFNQLGDVIANNNYEAQKKIDYHKTYNDLRWIDKISGNKGAPVLLGVHKDDWGLYDKPEVYSVVREIQGSNMGYIEVQKDVSSLDAIFIVPKEGIRVVVISGQEIFYTSKKDNKNSTYIDMANTTQKEIFEMKNPYTQENEVVSIHRSEEADIAILVIEGVDVMSKESAYIIPMTILIAGIFFLISLVFVLFVSARLTKPIKSLTYLMENTHIENLEDEIVFVSSNDEFETLNKSYQRVLNRLNDAIIKEKQMSLLQLQAQFDLLQTQVNPHFIYNVLNVISNRGVMSGDESICEISESLGGMLRYSTNNKKRYATIAQEVEYLERYLYLLKSRYEHKIEYTLDIDDEIHSQIIPKITFQQIVENSIGHGFINTTDIMKIEVKGWKQDERWIVEIRDNGQGFEEDTIIELIKRMKDVHDKLMKERKHIELEIGGMGIVNIYARLLLLYNDDLIFELTNTQSGASVRISASIGTVKEV